jgi:S-disulfanyl-L-cysteine oxidoreductase SoxD
MGLKTIVAPIIGWAVIAGFTSAQEAHSVWDGVYTEEQATRGGGFYARSCANCHGTSLEGADMSPALTGGAFVSNWNGSTVGDLFERIRISMPADRPGSLGRQEIADIVAFLLTSNRFPAGKTELPREAQLLKEIRFEARKPPAN